MLRNYLKIAIRTLSRHKLYTAINILGLAVGLASCILISLWLQGEMSYDRFHEHSNDLYLVPTFHTYGDQSFTIMGGPPALAPALKTDFPEILNATRYVSFARPLVRYGDKCFTERVAMADPAFIEMFTIPFVSGNSATALQSPHSLIISEKIAEKYFGGDDPVGKILTFDNERDHAVTGVFKNWPSYSTVSFDFLAPIALMKEMIGPDYLDTWTNCSFMTYVQLRPDADFQQVNEKISGRITQALPEVDVKPYLFPITKMRLYSIFGGGGRIETVRMFALIALLILAIACINFMNLTTARSSMRAREVALRKVAGAGRMEIARQFFGEALVLAALALVIALALVEALLPAFNDLAGSSITTDFLGNPTFLLGLIAAVIVTGIIAGSYPAILLSAYRPVSVLKSIFTSGSTKSWFRRVLVVSQFAISIVLIIGTLAVYSQYDFMQNKELGFDKEHLVYLPVRDAMKNSLLAFKQELLQNPRILKATLCSALPTGIYHNGTGFDWEGRDPDTDPFVTYLSGDESLLETFGIQLAAGRFFSEDEAGAVPNEVVINETFAGIIGGDSPVGRRLTIGSTDGTIIGVVKDFHFKPLSQSIEPLLIYTDSSRYFYVMVRLAPGDVSATLADMNATWDKFYPHFPFACSFLDQDLQTLYRRELRTGKIIGVFSILAIFICCLGLLGLASFTAERRTKEIGIRKVLGASTAAVIGLVSREFAFLVLIANLIAWPVAYFAIHDWLQDFAYRMSISWTLFAGAALVVLFIALPTIGFQAVRASLTNPVEVIRHE